MIEQFCALSLYSWCWKLHFQRLLGWMHRKPTHNTSTELTKNPTMGTPTCFSLHTLSAQHDHYYIEPTKAIPNSTIKLGSPYESSCKVELLYNEETFDFLSIGTFGMELLSTDPPTPALPVADLISDEQMEITENDLNMINCELEKLFDAEESDMSYVETPQRSSQTSMISVGYKAMEGGGGSGGHVNMAANCPLQNYLFAASVEVVERDREKEVKRERASLGELFKIFDDDENAPSKKCEGARKENISDFMKKVVKKLHSSSGRFTSASDKNGIPTKKKHSKGLVKMFHKKIYPEEMIKLSKSEKMVSNEDVVDESANKKSKKKLSWAGICRGNSPVDAEHWIKTDSDYLVLEL